MILENTFNELRKNKEKALVGYLSAGYPTPDLCVEIAIAMATSGVDILELGIPFSDPTADSPVVQRAAKKALENGTDMITVFSIIEKIRKRSEVSIVLFTYYNPLFTFGEENFCNMALQAGANGTLVLDLPFGEKSSLADFDPKNFPKIETVAPTTTADRLEQISATASGYLHLISMPGVTGMDAITAHQKQNICQKIRAQTATPICTDFGITTEEEVEKAAEFSDGIAIGSEFVAEIERNQQHKELPVLISEIAVKYKQATRR